MTRSITRLISPGFFVLIVVICLGSCAHFKTVNLNQIEEFAEMNCIKVTVPVKLEPNGIGTYIVVGTLCSTGDFEGKTLQVLLSGGGYGPVYFDFPYKPETYSYVRAAVRAGHATFNLSRIGIGESSRPPGVDVDVDANAYVIHQVIEALRKNEVFTSDFGPLVTVGHSMGSIMAIAHAVDYPDDVDGVILTGILHNTNPEYTEQIRDGSSLAIFDPRFAWKLLDFTYFTSKTGMRENLFYHTSNADSEVIAVDEETKETLTLGEIISVANFDRNRTLQIQVPTLMVNGDKDFTSCGGDIDCIDNNSVITYEKQFFSNAAGIEIYLPNNTGHVINLHPSAPESYRIMLDWVDRRIQ